MSGKAYTSYNLFFIHHEDTKFMFFLRALRVSATAPALLYLLHPCSRPW